MQAIAWLERYLFLRQCPSLGLGAFFGDLDHHETRSSVGEGPVLDRDEPAAAGQGHERRATPRSAEADICREGVGEWHVLLQNAFRRDDADAAMDQRGNTQSPSFVERQGVETLKLPTGRCDQHGAAVRGGPRRFPDQPRRQYLEGPDSRSLGLGVVERAIASTNAAHGFAVMPHTVAASGTLHYSDMVRVLDRVLTPKDMLVLDAGNNRIWVTSMLKLRTPGQLVVPGGVGGMGWGLPAAAATKLVYPERNTICVIGDGGAAMTLSTLATCVQEKLPITVIVANNQGLGMVRDNMKEKRIAVDFSPMDFARIAEGMGCIGVRVDRADALGDAIAAARNADRPTVIDLAIDPSASHVPASDY